MSESVDITPNKDGGILKEIIEEGSGEIPPPGSKVTVEYTGTFVDGTKFDSSSNSDAPFDFNLGKGTVIKAWDIGIASMKKGERAILTCAPEYAYGKAGFLPTIAPNTTLKFEVKLLDWKGEDLSPSKDGLIERIQITPGEGPSTPNDGAVVEVHLIGKYEGEVFEERNVTFTIGEGCESNIPKGVEIALQKFKKMETSRLIIKKHYAFGEIGNSDYNIPPNATVEYLVTLKSFEKVRPHWALDAEEKIEQAKLFKQKGNEYFSAEKYDLAIKFYLKISEYLEYELGKSGILRLSIAPDIIALIVIARDNGRFKVYTAILEKSKLLTLDKSIEKDRNDLMLASYLNLSLCYINKKWWPKAAKYGSLAIDMSPGNEKANYRRGLANLRMNLFESAINDFDICLRINPNNKVARDMRKGCREFLERDRMEEIAIYKNMFDKFAEKDIQREEFEKTKQPNVMSSVGQWGQEDREREPSEFEKENPDIILLNGTGEFKDM